MIIDATMAVVRVGALVQVAQRAQDLEASVAFYRNVLGGRFIAKFDPPGLAFVELAGFRLLLEKGAQPATLYFRVPDIQAAYAAAKAAGVPLEGEPHVIFRDADGTFGPAGSEEWMAFLRDPAENLVGLVETRLPAS